VVNGGTYYQPRLVDQMTDASGKTTQIKPKVVKQGVVTKQVSDDMVDLLEENNTNHIHEGYSYLNFGPNYSVGGKTGTAEVANPVGGYYPDKVNGTYLGFVGGNSPQYAIVVYNIEPTKYNGFAGAGTGQPLFAEIAHMLVNNFGVTPKK
jgi:cell division protein FtsI/penicillin-binding protein 2